MASRVEKWLISLVKNSESELESDSDSDLAFFSNIFMKNSFSVNRSLELFSDYLMKILFNDNFIDNFSDNNFINNSSNNNFFRQFFQQ